MLTDYQRLKEKYEDEKYFVNMISADDVIRFGNSIGLNEEKSVLDLCCGYGTMLKIWSDVYGIGGVGVDREPEFINTGRQRLSNGRVSLICGDVLQYCDKEKYDVVVCTELSTGLFGGFREGAAFFEKFVKFGGCIVFGKLFSKIPDPPEELIEFDGPLPTLSGIYDEVRTCGYLLTSMTSGSDESWERYIMRDAKKSAARLRQNPQDKQWAEWTDKWLRIYFDYRRLYEGWALFGMEKL